MTYRLFLDAAAIVLAFLTLLILANPLDAELVNDTLEPNNVLTYGLGYNAQRFSSLIGINKDDVAKLVPVGSLGLESQAGEVRQPFVMDGVMFVADAHSTVAINALTDQHLGRIPTYFDAAAALAGCCGVGFNNGLVLRGTLDAQLVALDQKTCKEIWKTKVAE